MNLVVDVNLVRLRRKLWNLDFPTPYSLIPAHWTSRMVDKYLGRCIFGRKVQN